MVLTSWPSLTSYSPLPCIYSNLVGPRCLRGALARPWIEPIAVGVLNSSFLSSSSSSSNLFLGIYSSGASANTLKSWKLDSASLTPWSLSRFYLINKSMLKIARCSSVSRAFLSSSSFSNSVDALFGIPLAPLILRPSWVIYFWMSRLLPLLDSIIFEILWSIFLGASSGCNVFLIFLMALLYCSLTGMSLKVNTGWSSLYDLLRAWPTG